MPALNLSTLIPLAVVALVVYLLHRHQGMQLWHAHRVPPPGGRPRGHGLRPGHLQRPVAAQRRASPLKGKEP